MKECLSIIIQLFLLLLLIISSFRCNNNVGPAGIEYADVFRIDLQNGFSNTPVKVNIDNSRVFNDTVSTGYVLSVAAIIPVQVFKGKHLLNIVIDGSIRKDTTFTIIDTLYIGVNYYKAASKIACRYQHHPFYYR